MTFNQTLVYANETATIAELILEPWGELYLINPGDKVQIVGTGGDLGSAFEIHQTPTGITVFGWVGSVVSVLREGTVMQPSPER